MFILIRKIRWNSYTKLLILFIFSYKYGLYLLVSQSGKSRGSHVVSEDPTKVLNTGRFPADCPFVYS